MNELPSPHELTYFIEIAHSRNLSRAAERLGVTQPALSVSVRRLESLLGVSLLRRHRGGVELTRAGTRFLAQARDLTAAWDQVRMQAARDESEPRGRYTIGCHTSVALYSVGQFMPALLSRHLAFEVQLVHDLSRRITEEVISSRIDFGIVVNPVRHPDLVIRKLFEDEVTAWSTDGRITPTLICDPELQQAQKIARAWERKGVRFNRSVTSPSLEVVASLAASGCGVAILPTRVARGQDLKRCAGSPTVADEICLAWRADLQKSAASRRLVDELIARLAIH